MIPKEEEQTWRSLYHKQKAICQSKAMGAGDLHTVALVGKNGTIDWCCLPSFDVYNEIMEQGSERRQSIVQYYGSSAPVTPWMKH